MAGHSGAKDIFVAGFALDEDRRRRYVVGRISRAVSWRTVWKTQMHEDSAHFPPVEPVKAGIRGLCPRCGQGKLFDGFLTMKPACASCGLDYGFADAGDGPVVFVILIVGFIVVGAALWMEVNINPPLWVHFLLWIPLAIVFSLVLMRMLKGVLINVQFRNNARQGEIDLG
jgi:uncharacterized protein (DUF983 family)